MLTNSAGLSHAHELEVLQTVLFTVVFQGLALWAACVLFAALMPKRFAWAKLFEAVSTPATRTVAALTPAIIPARLTPLITVFWLLTLRVMFFMFMASYGLLPKAGG